MRNLAKSSDSQYRLLFEAAQDGILLLDAGTRRISDANPFLCGLLDYSCEELIGKELWEIGLFTDKEQSQAAFRALQEQGHIRYEDLPLESKGGARREVEFVSQVYAQDGHPVVVCIIRDITERKRLQKEKYFLAAVVGSLEDSVVSVDFNTIITSWNQAAERLYGYPAQEVLGKSLTMLTLPEDGRDLLQKLEQVRQGQKVLVYDTERVHKSGEHLFLSITLSPVKDSHGRVIGVSTVARDITKRRQAEAALRETQERQRLMVESITDYGIFTLDTEGQIASWNPGAERIFGYQEEEAIGQPSALVFTPEDRADRAPEAEQRQAREEGRALDERWHVRRDGSRFYASGVLTPIINGTLKGYVKVVRDLTERKQMEDDLRRARTDLEEKVETRTRELSATVTQLKAEIQRRREAEAERQRLLERIVQAQEEERRRISRELHDHVGQQLTALRLGLEGLPRADNFAGNIETLKNIIHQLDEEVDFLAWELRPAALDTFGLAAAIQNFVEEWSQHYAVTAEFASPGMEDEHFAPEVEINLYRIMQEALNNIAKHAQAKQVSVVLTRQDGQLLLIVEDDGVGFAPKQIFTVDADDRGLGLVGMRERAALLGGMLEIESRPGEGTTIYVRVPGTMH